MKKSINDTLASLTGFRLQRVEAKKPAAAPAAQEPPPKPEPVTVAQGWERYGAKRTNKRKLGVEWNKPKKMGLDLPQGEKVAPYLDRVVFGPYLGTCEVLLEIGPGGGRFTEVLLPRCDRLIALDTSETMLKLLRRRFKDTDKIEYVHGDGFGLSGVKDSSVDRAFSYGVFVHLQHWDIYNYMEELERVLVPGGKAIIQHSNTLSELGWKHFKKEVPKSLNRHKRFQTFIVNTPELMREFVTRAGLECVDTITDVVRRDCITLIRKPD